MLNKQFYKGAMLMMRDLCAMVVGVVIFLAGFVTSSVVHHIHDGGSQCPFVTSCCTQCTCVDCNCCQGCCK